MYASVGASPTSEWVAESVRWVAERLGRDLFGAVIDAPGGGLAACGLVNVVPRLPRPGRHSHEAAYVQWVSTDPGHHRKGYARRIMQALIAETDRRGIEVIELHATALGKPLYEEFGFFVKTDNVAMMALRGDAARDAPASARASVP